MIFAEQRAISAGQKYYHTPNPSQSAPLSPFAYSALTKDQIRCQLQEAFSSKQLRVLLMTSVKDNTKRI